MKIKFLGAAREVTGSMYLIETKDVKFLVDCGIFQGKDSKIKNELRLREINPSEIEFIILTHAHLDHSGMIPLFVKKGFKGKIFSTHATRDISALMFLDAAEIQEEEAERISRKNIRKGLPPEEPLFTKEDVIVAIKNFETYDYGEEIKFKNMKFRFLDAGHILGSAFVEMEIEGKKITFSGDLGNLNKPVIRNPNSPLTKKPDLLVIESTYGNRNHKPFEESVLELKEIINSTCERGLVLIPSFALERTQDLLYVLRELQEREEIKKIPVFLDSPLAISITKIFKLHRECFDEETKELIKQDVDPLNFPGLHFVRKVTESKKLNDLKKEAIIIAGSGMCEGGRIQHHLKHHAWKDTTSIMFVGYQAKGTLGREIVDGKRYVNIMGEEIKINAKIYTVNGFSSHADKDELLKWISEIDRNSKIILTHGEEEVMEKFKEEILNKGFKEIYIPSFMEEISIP